MVAKRPRIFLYSPHFAEYSARLAIALSTRADVLFAVDSIQLERECREDLIDELRARVKLVLYKRDGGRNKLVALPKLLLRALAFRPHHIHVQEHIDDLSRLIVGFLGTFIPVSLTIHDPKPHGGNDLLYATRNAGHRAVIRNTAKIFHVHGAVCAAQLREILNDQRPIVSTMHGIILTPRADEIRTPEKGRILMFGRMEAYKGLAVLLDAADILRARGHVFKIVLAGRGPELDQFKDRISNLDDIECIAGYLTPTAVIEQFQRASVTVLPYTDATQSGVAAASFGNHRPVVASAVGGLVDVVHPQENGLLVEPRNAQDLANKLEALLLSDELQARLSDGAAAIAAGELGWRTIADQIFAALSLPNQ